MSAIANKTYPRQTTSAAYRTEKSPSAPCVLKEHCPFSHTNRECSKQQRRSNRSAPPTTSKPAKPSDVTNDEKVRQYNQLVASGVVSFNTSVDSSNKNDSPNPVTPVTPSEDPNCQFAPAYNAIAGTSPTTSTSKPIYTDTACNRHMFGDEHLLKDLCDIEPVLIGVANKDRSAGVVATQMGTVELNGFNIDGHPTSIKIRNVLFAPYLPANLVSVSALYSSGFRTVDPHYGRRTSNQDLYYSNDIVILPARKESSLSGLWLLHHQSAPCAYSTSVPEKTDTNLWHLRFGHLNHRSTALIMETVMGSSPSPASICESCVLGKQVRNSHSGTLPHSYIPLHRIHCDLAGPFPAPTLSGYLYTMVLIDDATRMNWIILLKSKSHAFLASKHFHASMQTTTNRKISVLKTDRGGEFTSSEFSQYLLDHGILREMGPPESPQQNSVVERFNRTLGERLRSQLFHGNLPPRLWGEVALATSFSLNLCPSKAINSPCPEFSWQKLALRIKEPKIPYRRLRAIGCLGYTIPPGHHTKLQARLLRTVLVGYEKNSNAYRLWDPKSNKILISNDVVFDENSFPLRENINRDPSELSILQDEVWDDIWEIPSAPNPSAPIPPAPRPEPPNPARPTRH